MARIVAQLGLGLTTVSAVFRLLADALKELLDELNPIADQASVFNDLITAALCEVDWHEIADAFLEE